MRSFRLTYVNLGSKDPIGLACFYADLFGWPRPVAERGATSLFLDDPDGGTGIACQFEAEHVAPAWPAGREDQMMQLHLEIRVGILDDAVEHAVRCGAVPARYQPQDDVRVCLDPAGHPFCLYVE